MLDDNTLDSYPCATYDWPWVGDKPGDDEGNINMWAHGLSTSGGYSEHIFKYAAKELFNMDLTTVEYKNLR